MNSGDLDKRITIQYQTKAPDGMGGFTVTWVDYAMVWAAIWPISADERIQAGQEVMTITHRIRIRYRSSLNPSWRVKFGVKYYNIVSIINPSMANEQVDLMCKEAA